jgi:Predicted metal-sulfur cluster biosynthetic enzyme
MNVITNNNQKCERALEALKQVNDPEIGLNVVDLGLIYQLDFDEDNQQIYVLMTLTTPFCPMGESLTGAVENALISVFPQHKVNLALTFNPGWSADNISEEGKLFLHGA